MTTILLVVISLLPLLFGNQFTKQNADVLFLLFAVIGAAGVAGNRNLLSFLTPNAIVFFYISLSMALGAWGFSNGYVLSSRSLAVYEDWRYSHLAVTTMMMSLAILMAIDNHYRRKFVLAAQAKSLICGSAFLASALSLLPFFFLTIDLSFIGGSGDFSEIARSVFAMFIVVSMLGRPAAIRWSVYLLLILVFATFSVHEKREAIFLILPILFAEFIQYPRKPTIGTALLSIPLAGFLLSLILIMSVARGYGGFGQLDSFFAAMPFVGEYIRSDLFVAGLLNNIEANYFFFHAVNSIEMVIRDTSLLTAGSTLIKPLFVFLPRSIAPWKPEGMITLYTFAFDPAFRMRGGSWPASFISELFWNFSFLAVILTLPFALLLTKLQFWILRAFVFGRAYFLVLLFFAYMNVITLVRGSGLDQYFIHIAFAAMFVSIAYGISKILPKRASLKLSLPAIETTGSLPNG